MKSALRLSGAIVALVACAATAVGAQIPLTPRALGLGGAVIGSSRGFESVLYNPANLGLLDGPAWSLALTQISVGSSVLGPRLSDLPDFIEYDEQTPERRRELLSLIPPGGTAVDVDLRAPVVALQVGRFGFALSYNMMAEHTVDRDLVELFFEGYQPGRTDYGINNTVGTRSGFWDVVVGYGREVGPVSAGAAAHYYHGTALVRTMAFQPRFGLLEPVEVDYVGASSERGSGFGLDVGVALTPVPNVTVSAAIANLISSISWDEELVGRRITIRTADFQNGRLTDLETRYSTSRQEIGSAPQGQYAAAAQGLFDGQRLPTTLRLGTAWMPASGTELGAAFHTSLRSGRLGGRWEQLLGVGVQQRIPLVTLRAGASSNLEGGSLVGGGLKLGVLELGLASFSTDAPADSSRRNGWAGSFSVNVGTPSTLADRRGLPRR